LIRETLEVAKRIVEKEMKELLRLSERYVLVSKAVSMGARNWSSMKRSVETVEGKKMGDSSFGRILRRLEKMEFLEKTPGRGKTYRIVDPMIDRMIKDLRF
jgi:AAA+ ATPase superfamily predicted ATPase